MSRAVVLILSIAVSLFSAGQALAQASGGTGGAVGQAAPMMSKIRHFFTGIGDPVSTYLLNTMFGPIFAGATQKTILSVIAGPINLVIVVLAALLIIYNFIWGAASTAHEGELMGRRTHSFWAPVRMALAAMLLIPLPAVGGYSTGQLLVAWLVKGSTATATYIWQTAAQAITTGGVPVTGAVNRGVPLEVAHAAWNMAVCEQAISSMTSAGNPNSQTWVSDGPWTASQLVARGFGAPVRNMSVPSNLAYADNIFGKYSDIGQYIFVPVPADGITRNFTTCGAIVTPAIPTGLATGTFNSPNADSQATATFQAAHRDAIKQLLAAYRQPARNVVTSVLQNKPNNATPASNITDPLVAVNTTLGQAIDSILATNEVTDQKIRDYLSGASCASTGNNQPLQQMSQSCTAASWLGAGGFYLAMAQANQKNIDLLATTSSVAAPVTWIQDSANTSPSSSMSQQQVADKYATIGIQADALWRAGYGVTAPGGDATQPLKSSDSSKTSAETAQGAKELFEADMSYLETLLRTASGQIFGALNQNPVVSAALFGQTIAAWTIPAVFAIIATSFFVPGAVVFANFLGFLTMIAGFLGFIVPLLPYVYWNLAIAGYVIIIAEAMFAGAIWAVAHIRTEGEGIAGSAQAGYMILMSLTLTPVLMIVGLFVGMAALTIGATLVNMTMGAAITALPAGGVTFVTAFIFLFIVFAYLYWMMIEKAFTLVGEFPSRVLRFFGHNESPLTKGEEREARLAMAGASYKAGGAFGQVTNVGASSVDKFKKWNTQRKSVRGSTGAE